MWRTWGTRILRLIGWFTPTVREAWEVGLAAFIPFFCLAIGRVWVISELGTSPVGWDRIWVQLGEMEFWGGWFGIFVLLRRIPGRWWRGFVRVAMHVLTVAVLAPSLAELNFYQVTGGRADLDTVLFGIEDFERVWPVMASELRPIHYVGVLLLVAFTLVPLFRRPKNPGWTWFSRAWILVLFPGIYCETQGRVRPSKGVRELQRSMVETLFWEAMERRNDVYIAPPAEDLVPLAVGTPSRTPNVVVIFLESVGASRTTLYNPAMPSTPNLVEYAKRGLYATNMYAAVTHTTKALITTLCGDYPNLVGDAREALPGGLPGRCLPDILDKVGYRTAFFQPARADFEDRQDLVHQMGFEHVRTKESLGQSYWESSNYFGLDDRSMLGPGVEWSEEPSDKPFFAAYLTLASHHNYTLPKHVQLLDFPGIEGREEHYENAVRYVDDFTGRLIRAYEARGLAENTLFIILGDHGEGFGEHGRWQHDLTIYDEGLHIPFVMYGPQVLEGKTGTIDGNRQQIDVLPTVLDVLGLPVTAGHPRGSSVLAPAPEGRVMFHSCWRSHRCLARREGNQVFIDHYGERASQVFDVAADPEQQSDLGRSLSKERAAWQADTRDWNAKVRGRYVASAPATLAAKEVRDDSPAIATWGDGVLSLLGCSLQQTEIVPGENLWIDCRWRAERAVTEAWTLVPKVEVGQREGTVRWTPFQSAIRMWNWRPGFALTDSARVTLPAGTPAGEGVVSVGWERVSGGSVLTDAGKARVVVGSVLSLGHPKPNGAGLEGIEEVSPPVLGPEWTLPALDVAAPPVGEETDDE